MFCSLIIFKIRIVSFILYIIYIIRVGAPECWCGTFGSHKLKGLGTPGLTHLTWIVPQIVINQNNYKTYISCRSHANHSMGAFLHSDRQLVHLRATSDATFTSHLTLQKMWLGNRLETFCRFWLHLPPVASSLTTFTWADSLRHSLFILTHSSGS